MVQMTPCYNKSISVCISYIHMFPIMLCVGVLSWLHLTPLRKCGSPRRNTRRIAPAPSTGRHFKRGWRAPVSLISAVSHPSPFLAWPPSVHFSPSTRPDKGTFRASYSQLGMPSASPAQLLVGTPAGTGTGLGRAFLARSAPFYAHRTPKSFAGHRSILLTVVSFEAYHSALKYLLHYLPCPVWYCHIYSNENHEGECYVVRISFQNRLDR